MSERDGVFVGVTCSECGHDFDVGVSGIELETCRFTCPACNVESGFSQEDIETLASANAHSLQIANDVLDGKRKL